MSRIQRMPGIHPPNHISLRPFIALLIGPTLCSCREFALDNGLEYVTVPHTDSTPVAKEDDDEDQELGEGNGYEEKSVFAFFFLFCSSTPSLSVPRSSLLPLSSFSLPRFSLRPNCSERLGADRVKEALECNMWDNMKMKARPKTGFAAQAEAEVLEEEAAEAAEAAEATATAAAAPKGSKDERLAPALEALARDTPLCGGDEDDEMVALEQMLEKVKTIRERAGNVSDEERRREAEKAISSLLKMLPGDDESDDDA